MAFFGQLIASHLWPVSTDDRIRVRTGLQLKLHTLRLG